MAAIRHAGDGKIGVSRGLWGRERWTVRAQDFEGSGATLYDTIMVDTHHYTFVQAECPTLGVKSKVNNGLWVIQMSMQVHQL